MAEGLVPVRWWYRWLFAGLAAALMFLQLLPLSTVAGGLPGPDLLVCLAIAWVLRRPEYVPALLIAVVFLMQDLLVMRPPGPWAATVLLGCEVLRRRPLPARDVPFVLEWGIVGATLLAMVLAYRLALALAMVPQPGLGLMLVQLVMTVSVYPAVVFVTQFVFRIRKTAPGERRLGGVM